jgi:hypothetical protein
MSKEQSKAFGAAVLAKWQSMSEAERAKFILSLPYSCILWMRYCENAIDREAAQ